MKIKSFQEWGNGEQIGLKHQQYCLAYHIEMISFSQNHTSEKQAHEPTKSMLTIKKPFIPILFTRTWSVAFYTMMFL